MRNANHSDNALPGTVRRAAHLWAPLSADIAVYSWLWVEPAIGIRHEGRRTDWSTPSERQAASGANRFRHTSSTRFTLTAGSRWHPDEATHDGWATAAKCNAQRR